MGAMRAFEDEKRAVLLLHGSSLAIRVYDKSGITGEASRLPAERPLLAAIPQSTRGLGPGGTA